MYHQTNTAAGEEPGLNGLDWTLQTKLLREATHAELKAVSLDVTVFTWAYANWTLWEA